MERDEFGLRLSQLRLAKGVSARDMSLSIGQSAGYINNLETGFSFPSMTVFFYICEYLDITPSEFFDTDSKSPTKERKLIDAVKGLRPDQLENLIALAKDLRR